MRTITKYVCEICGYEHEEQTGAVFCESKGVEKPLLEAGTEILVRDDWNGGFGTVWFKTKVTKVETIGHYVKYGLGNLADSDDEADAVYPEDEVFGNDELLQKIKIYDKEKHDGTEGVPNVRENAFWYMHCEKCGEPTLALKYLKCKHCNE